MAGDARSYGFLGDQERTLEMARLLGRVPLFSGLDQEYLLAIARHGVEMDPRSGETLVEEGDVGGFLGVILDGTLRVDAGGKTVATLSPGDFFGEMAVLDGGPRSASVVAETDGRVLAIRHTAFNEILNTYPDMARRLLLTLSQRLRERNAVNPGE